MIELAPDIKWKPIEKMTTDQVKDLMEKSKVYIDFGNHPGKDRIPREAAMSGCVVITGKKGSAAFYEDVRIPDRYKIDENNTSLSRIIELIRNSIDNYETIISEFDEYRKTIIKEKERFERDVKNIFCDLR